jgi:hypothetical protein
MAGKRRRLDVARMVADARRGFIDDGSVAHPPYGRAGGERGGSNKSQPT